MDSTHECPAPGCPRRVPRSHLACKVHWYQVPRKLRTAVWRAYREHGMGTPEHTHAIHEAIASLHP